MQHFKIMLFPIILVILGPMGIDLFLPAISDVAKTFDASPAAAQWSISAFVLALGLGQMPFGSLSDRFGRKPIALFGLSVFLIASILAYFAVTMTSFLTARFLQGLGASATTVVAFAIVRDRFEGVEASNKFSWLTAALNIAPSLAPMLGAAVILLWGWQANFIVYSICASLSFIIAIIWQKETADLSHRPTISFSSFYHDGITVIKTSKSWPGALICISTLSFIISYLSIAPVILVDQLGLTPFEFSKLFCLNALFIMLSSMSVQHLNKWLGITAMVSMGLSFVLIASIILCIVGINGITSPWSFMAPINLASIGFAFSFGNAQGRAMDPHGKLAGIATGLLGTLQMSLASLIAAMLIAFDASSTVMFGGFFAAIIMIALIYWLKSNKIIR